MKKRNHLGVSVLVAIVLFLSGHIPAHAETNSIVITPIQRNGYLSNPGIGWQNNDNKLNLPETVLYAGRTSITWKILNPSEGVYDWKALDAYLSQSIAAGKQVSFRVMTMIGGSYGGHAVPDWVLAKGAVILSGGEPDYSNCAYQQEWGNFVNKMLERYDGNPNIAFIDISGYGNFSEWSWQNQTQWDPVWDSNYKAAKASPSTMGTLDGQARRRLADIFIGGSFTGHQCKSGSTTKTVTYSYAGAQRTQLVMPFAGISQSTEYVITRRSDVGFRYDCLGRSTTYLASKEVTGIWRTAPVVYEFCGANSFNPTVAATDLAMTHGSVVHNNSVNLTYPEAENLMRNIGYRYTMTQAKFNNPAQGQLSLSMIWKNIGTAPSYPKMGQDFKLHVYLVDELGTIMAYAPVNADISKWLPGSENLVDFAVNLPSQLAPKAYSLKVSIVDQRTGKPLQLAFEGADAKGTYFVSQVNIVTSDATASMTPSPTPIATDTVTFTPTAQTLPTIISTNTPLPVLPTSTLAPVLPSPTLQSSPTSVAPTATSIPPTETQVLPTNTFTPPTPTQTATLPAATIPPTSTPQVIVEKVYDDKDLGIVYSNGWQSVSKTQAYQKSYKVTNTKGSYVVMKFTGETFTVLHTTGPGFGTVDVYVDNVLVGTINERTKAVRYQRPWTYPGKLPNGLHELKLVFTGTNNLKGSVDAVVAR